jgi:hypothetical protein
VGSQKKNYIGAFGSTTITEEQCNDPNFVLVGGSWQDPPVETDPGTNEEIPTESPVAIDPTSEASVAGLSLMGAIASFLYMVL